MAAFRFTFLLVIAALLGVAPAHAQRQMENLGRGVIAMRTSSTQVYVGWRLFGNDPASLGFNVYRSINGAAATKLNGATPITASTNYLDTPGSTALANPVSYTVVPVLNGVEQTAGAAFTLAANATAGRQYQTLPLATPSPNPASTYPYDVKFCWVGDFDGDGEYDFLVDRHSTAPSAEREYLEAYKRDGTFLWRMDMGPNSVNQYAYEPGSSAISIGDTDNVTVFDLDGDGRAEVAVRTANGVTVTNAAGSVVATVTHAGDTAQFVSIINGLTGAELARATLPNPWAVHGTLTSKCAIGYFDGVRPSVLFYGYNRADTGEFHRVFTAFDYRSGALTQRWSTAQTFPGAEGHQIRIADVDNDGKDEVVDIGHVIDDDGTQLFVASEITHGDRFQVTDIDPDRPGLETYIIQQYNPTMLATALYGADTGAMIKKWYSNGLTDVGRGIVADITAAHKGCELWSTQPGIHNARGRQIYTNNIWPPEGVWWDADLARELIDGAGSGALNPVLNKFNPGTGNADRLWTLYNDGGAYSITQAYGGRPAFWGDILGDWREELVFVTSDYTALRIYSTVNVAANRLYTLMHNPQYRAQTTAKGYVQSSNVDYYLGYDMTVPPPPPMVSANRTWTGGTGASTWDIGATAAWSANGSAASYADGQSVLFDLTGNNTSPVNLAAALQPSAVTVYSPKNYTFSGSGSLTGAMPLVKAGAGTLTFSASHSYSGATTIWDGALRVDGTLSQSPVTVWGGTWGGATAAGATGGRLAGSGTVSQPVTLQYRGALTPGPGMNAAGTLTLGAGLTATDGSALVFDLTNDPTGLAKANDRLAITGSLSLSGTVAIVVNALDTQLAAGTYTLATYSGALTGSIANLAVTVPPGTPYSVSLSGGALTLTVASTRAPAAITWAGGLNANTWDLAATANWRRSGNPDVFVSGDTVALDDTGSANPVITLNITAPIAGLTVSGATNYTLSGSGTLAGSGGLTHAGPGTFTLNTTNTYTGATTITGGVLAIDNLNDGGSPSTLGAASAAASNLVINGGTLRLTGPQTNTNRSLTLGAVGGTIDLPSASLQLSGVLTGTGVLTKSGPGTLILASANTYSGGTTLTGGTLLLASATANTSGLGSGAVTLSGGTLSMSDVQQSETAAWNLVVPAAASARLEVDGRCTLTGSLTGAGDLTVFTPYVRTEFKGNWSAFTGRLFVVPDSDGGDYRLWSSAGLPAAELNLAADVYAVYQNTLTANLTVPLGALSGAAGSSLSGSATASYTLTWQIGARNTGTTFAGSITNATGPAAIIKIGTGTLTLSGASAYTGATTVSAGKLVLAGGSLTGTAVTVQSGAGFGGNGSVTGNVIFNTGSTLLATPAAGPLAITGNLTLDGAINVAPSPGTTLSAGTYQLYTYTGTLTGTPSFTWTDPGYNATFDTSVAGLVSITLSIPPRSPATLTWTGSASSTWDASALNWTYAGGTTRFQDDDSVNFDGTSAVTTVSLSGTLKPAAVTVSTTQACTFSGTGSISGAATLAKSGSGTLTISSAHSYTGGTTLNAGTLVLGNAAALGTGTLTLAGGTLGTGALTPTNAIAVSADSRITGGSGGGTQGIKAVSGSGVLTLEATTGVFDLEGSFAGFTGTVALAGTGSFRLFGSVGSASADFDLGTRTLNARSGTAFSLGSLSGDTGSVLQGSSGSGNLAAVTYTLGANNHDTTFSGVIANGNAAASLSKTGSGTLTLAGASTYSGTTSVSAGSLLMNGSLGSTTVLVSSGAAFGGTGTLGGNLTLTSGATLAFGVTPSFTRGVTVSGVTTLNGTIPVSPRLFGASLAPGTYTVLTYVGTLLGSPAFTWSDATGSGLLATFSTDTSGQVLVTLITPLQSWRQTYFGTTAATGTAANDADPDGDGLVNLLEYALAGDPLQSGTGILPVSGTSAGHLTFTFPRQRSDLIYEVEVSADLATWAVIATNPGTIGQSVTVTDPQSISARRFLRLKVTSTSP